MQPLGNAEIAEKRSSSADEMLKTRKTTFRTPTMSRNREKQPFVPLRRAEIAKKRVS